MRTTDRDGGDLFAAVEICGDPRPQKARDRSTLGIVFRALRAGAPAEDILVAEKLEHFLQSCLRGLLL